MGGAGACVPPVMPISISRMIFIGAIFFRYSAQIPIFSSCGSCGHGYGPHAQRARYGHGPVTRTRIEHAAIRSDGVVA